MIESPVAERMPVAFNLQDDMNEPHGLHGFAERVGGVIRHLFADAGNFFEFGFAFGVGFFGGNFGGKFGVTQSEFAHGVQHNQHGFVKNILVDCVGLRQVKFGLQVTHAVFVAEQTFIDDAFVINCKMSVARVEFAFHAERRQHVQNFFGQQSHAAVVQTIIFPERRDFAKLTFGFFGDVKNVAVALFKLVEFVDDKTHCVFGENRRVTIFRRLVADDKRFVFDVNRHVFEDVFQTECAFHDGRLILIRTVSLRHEYGAFGVDVRFLVERFFAKSLHSLRQRPEMFAVLHKRHSLKLCNQHCNAPIKFAS